MLGAMHNWSWLITLVVSFILVPLLNSVRKSTLDTNRKMTATFDTTEQLAHDRIFHDGAKYLHQGYVTFDELDNFERISQSYFRMGGNGTGHRIHDDVMRLPKRAADYTLEKYGGEEEDGHQ